MKLLVPLLTVIFLGSPALAQSADSSATSPADGGGGHGTSAARSPGIPVPSLETGDDVTPDDLNRLAWVQGASPGTWEPGKVYLLNGWAITCEPCVGNIPRLTKLHKTYADKGLRVLGINVWDNSRDRVAAFVREKGAAMPYPVAYNGRGGPFETGWLKPSDTTTMPTSFVVKDGKLLIRLHTVLLEDKFVEALLAGGGDQDKALQEMAPRAKLREDVNRASTSFKRAAKAKNTGAMERCLSVIENLDPGYSTLESFRIEVQVARKNWPWIDKHLGSLPEGKGRLARLIQTHKLLSAQPETPVRTWRAMADLLSADLPGQTLNPYEYTHLAEALWKAGDRTAAIAAVEAGIEAGKLPRSNNLPGGYFSNMLTTMEDGRFPTQAELDKWLSER